MTKPPNDGCLSVPLMGTVLMILLMWMACSGHRQIIRKQKECEARGGLFVERYNQGLICVERK
jgi:hypothetical protein